MFFHVINVVKNKLLHAIKQELQYHPIFKDTYVSNHFLRKERPARAIILTSASGSHRRLSLDDLLRSAVPAFSALYRIADFPSSSIEWVEDDVEVIQQNRLSAPGYYYVSVDEKDEYNYQWSVSIDPLFEKREYILRNATGTETSASFSFTPIAEKVMWVYAESPDGSSIRMLYDPSQITKDIENKRIIFNQPLSRTESVFIDYRYAGEPFGPFTVEANAALRNAIPGVVIAFGDRIRVGDKQVVRVRPRIVPSYDVYSGEWDLSFDMTVLALDPNEQETLADYAATVLWAKNRAKLEDDHIILQELDIGAESTDTLIESSGEPYFMCTIGLTIKTFWEFYVPYIREWEEKNLPGTYTLHDPSLSDEDAAKTMLLQLHTITPAQLAQMELIEDNRVQVVSPRVVDFKNLVV